MKNISYKKTLLLGGVIVFLFVIVVFWPLIKPCIKAVFETNWPFYSVWIILSTIYVWHYIEFGRFGKKTGIPDESSYDIFARYISSGGWNGILITTALAVGKILFMDTFYPEKNCTNKITYLDIGALGAAMFFLARMGLVKVLGHLDDILEKKDASKITKIPKSEIVVANNNNDDDDRGKGTS